MTRASPEPPVGSVKRGGDGSVWRKTRHLGPAWGPALGWALSAIRVNHAPSDEDVRGMGYERVGADDRSAT